MIPVQGFQAYVLLNNIAESQVTNLVTDLAATEKTANKNQPYGYPGLNSSSQVTANLASKTQVPTLDKSQISTASTWALADLPTGTGFLNSSAGTNAYRSIAESDVTNLSSDLAATEKTANKGQASGYAGLNSSSQVTNNLAAITQVPAGSNGQALFTRTGSASWSSVAESDVTNLQTDLAATEKTANKGVANGYAGLNSSSQVTNNISAVTQLPAGTNNYALKTNNSGVVTWGTFAGLLDTDTGEKQANKNVANGYAGLNASGILSSSLIPLFYGDGSDGAVTISGNTTLSRDMYYSSLTVNNGITLNTAGNIIRVTGTTANSGTITDSTNGGTGGTAGSGGASVGSGANGNNGGDGQPGTAGTVKNGYQAGSGGYGGGGGGSGGGGNGGASGAGGNGGNGGNGGGIVVIFTSTLNNTGTITVAGSAGASGNNGSNAPATTYTGGSGGGGAAGNGGSGGIVKLVYKTLTSLGTVSVSGGAAGSSTGSGGTSSGGSCNGGPGHSNAGGGGGGGGSSGYGSGGRGGKSQGTTNYGSGGTGGCNAPDNATSGTNTAAAGSNGVLIQDNV